MIYDYKEDINLSGLKLLFFYSSYNSNCTINESIIKTISTKFNISIIRINVTKYYSLKEKYNIKKIPAYLLLKDGNVLSKYTGIINSKSITNWIINYTR